MSKVIHDLIILENRQPGPEYHVLVCKAPETLPVCYPGQFAEVAVPSSTHAFLRRPFSIHNVDYQNNTISFLIKMVGQGTRTLGQLPTGTVLNAIYPLGKGFSLNQAEPVLLVGGGCGIAPLLFLAKTLKLNGYTVHCLLGGRSADDLVEIPEFRETAEVYLTTEDGTQGEKGFVTQHSIFRELAGFTRVFACGPEGMLRAVALASRAAGVSCEVSLENNMACGIGACLCCVVETRKGNRCVCTEGPVFNVLDLKGWESPQEVADNCPVI
ncbi:MAG: dihydroorotate dehydrogenase electron transfer subunit [Bacteroidetes bacterium]|nr:dihydroorotate dehydrogenase electron transfer subunit [Bacteroidota bacterium]